MVSVGEEFSDVVSLGEVIHSLGRSLVDGVEAEFRRKFYPWDIDSVVCKAVENLLKKLREAMGAPEWRRTEEIREAVRDVLSKVVPAEILIGYVKRYRGRHWRVNIDYRMDRFAVIDGKGFVLFLFFGDFIICAGDEEFRGYGFWSLLPPFAVVTVDTANCGRLESFFPSVAEFVRFLGFPCCASILEKGVTAYRCSEVWRYLRVLKSRGDEDEVRLREVRSP